MQGRDQGNEVVELNGPRGIRAGRFRPKGRDFPLDAADIALERASAQDDGRREGNEPSGHIPPGATIRLPPAVMVNSSRRFWAHESSS